MQGYRRRAWNGSRFDVKFPTALAPHAQRQRHKPNVDTDAHVDDSGVKDDGSKRARGTRPSTKHGRLQNWIRAPCVMKLRKLLAASASC